MLNFGKLPVRSINSFGVAGLLGEGCKVYYDSLFTAQNVGRMSDLLSALLRTQTRFDDLRLRALLLFSVFEVYQSQLGVRAETGKETLPEPLVVECGLDQEKIALGVAFSLPATVKLTMDGLPERLAKGEPQGEFERLLWALSQHSHRLVLRYQASVGRVEIISLLGIPGRVADSELLAKVPILIVPISKPDSEVAGSVSYTQLSDLDFAGLLRVEVTAAGLTQSARTVNEDEILVAGKAAEAEIETLVKGRKPEDDDSSVRVEGTTAHLGGASKVVIAGDKPAENDGTDTVVIRGEKQADEKESGGLFGLFKKVHLFGGGGKDKTESDGITESEESPEAVEAIETVRAPDAEVALSREESAGETDVDKVADTLLTEIEQGQFGKTLERVQKEIVQVREEVGNEHARRWIDGITSELMAEKARLSELAKNLNRSIRQKEIEFKNREGTLIEQVRQRDENLKGKTIALTRAKEQIAQMSVTVDRLRAASRQTPNDDSAKKLAQNERALALAKEENSRLMARVEEMRKELSSAQANQHKSRSSESSTETAMLKVKYERITRQNEQMKQINEQLNLKLQQLTEKLESSKINRGGGNGDEMKKRLENALKQSNSSQKEVIQLQNKTERLNIRVQELEREEARLKKELLRAQNEARLAKANGGGKGNPPKAA